MVGVDKASFGTETCEIRLGHHSLTGDLKRYEIQINPVNRLGANLLLVFDLVAKADHNFVRYPRMFVQDADGNIVFESTGNIEETRFEVGSEYKQEATGKRVPQAFTYTFRDGGKPVVYTMESTQELSEQEPGHE